jgi:hypothetical protein
VKTHLIERHIAPEDLHKPIELEACDRVPVSLTHRYMYISISLYLKVKTHLIERHVAPEDLHESIELEPRDRVPGYVYILHTRTCTYI